MNILAIEPYYGGSHKAYIDGLSTASSHNWTVLTLPPYKWKWRMRHAAVTFANQIKELTAKGQCWDLIFCSDMLNLAEFKGLIPRQIRDLPCIAYFHENQLTYPVRRQSERDYQFAVTNMTTALAADKVWFNSAFHRDSFLDALLSFLKKMPDHQPFEAIEQIKQKSQVYPPGIEPIARRADRKPGPIRILWSARWEHDKNPEDFFQALKILKDSDIDFHLSVIGQQFRDVPEIFEWAHAYFKDHIEHWGYQKNRSDYLDVLRDTDVAVSTAQHEFFGIGIVEAIAAGAYPLLPQRLSYPEILGLGKTAGVEEFFYNGNSRHLADKLKDLAKQLEQNGSLWPKASVQAQGRVEKFKWKNLAPVLDKAFEKLIP
ncbi:MAG: tRNA-queuosine alpha-mannosyltransferase domain-containing protein [Planctomycetota bacterium]|jgi:glycosyltransferase involved in cell wall biosynthesis